MAKIYLNTNGLLLESSSGEAKYRASCLVPRSERGIGMYYGLGMTERVWIWRIYRVWHIVRK
ncbi:7036_t:CDS:1, partial [Acaulospora morrowiae]